MPYLSGNAPLQGFPSSHLQKGGRNEGTSDDPQVPCQNCHSYYNELPNCLVPYKHYEAEVIADVLDEVILPEDLDSEDYLSFNTMLRWLQLFRENLQRIEGYLRTAGYQILNLGEELLFTPDLLLNKIIEGVSK